MKIFSTIFLTFIGCFSLFQTYVSAQSSQDRDLRQQEIDRQRNDSDLARREQILRGVGNSRDTRTVVQPVVLSEDQRNRNLERTIESEEKQALINKMSAVAPQYYNKYEKLLRDKKFGLFRIFPDKGCNNGQTVSTEELERCENVPPVKGGGSYYSFRLKTNGISYLNWWDIHFKDNNFIVGNNMVQGIISEIGKLNAENFKDGSKAFEFLSDYKPGKSVEEINKESENLEKGIQFNGFTYSNHAPIKINSAYVMRVTAYELKSQSKNSGFLTSGNGQDVTLIFQIVGKEQDGSLVILWKETKSEMPRRKLADK